MRGRPLFALEEPMNKKISISQMIAFLLLAVATTFVLTLLVFQSRMSGVMEDMFALETGSAKRKQVEKLIRENYIGDLDETSLEDGLLTGLVYGIGDPYSAYYDKENTQLAMDTVDGRAVGIGISVSEDAETGLPMVQRVYTGSAADQNGLMAGDLIVTVEGETCADLGYYVSLDRMLGDEGTIANFEVLRGENYEQRVAFSIERAAYRTQSVFFELTDRNIGYIRVEDFDRNAAADFDFALSQVEQANPLGVVFDLRGNPGGELDTICGILDRLLPEGTITTIRYKNREPQVFTSDAEELELPAVVLVDEYTASAAELFAAAMQDYDKAVIVGTTTYGKGCMQEIISLGDGTSLRLTTALFDPPKSPNFNGAGVVPDIEATLSEAERANGYGSAKNPDTQIQAALDAVLAR